MVRISGLIRLADVVRRELGSATIATEQRDHLRRHVQQSLEHVQNILRESRAGVNDMPAPSQRAFHFLSSVNWDVPAMSEPGAATSDPSAATSEPPAGAAARQTIVSWRGLTAFIARALHRLATDLTDAELKQVGQNITRMSRQMELTIERESIAPDRLSPITREQRGWLALLSQEENLAAYVQARRAANRVIDAAAVGSRHYPPPLEIHFRPVNNLYKLRATRARPVLLLPTPAIAFDESHFEQLGSLIFHRGGAARQQVIELMTGEGYQAMRAELEALGGIVEQGRGAAHDLGQSFDRVNAAYFGGKMARPRLTWNRTFTGRKFGHYDYILDTLMVSRTLDAQKVPEFVVDFLVFHELLHKFHGIHWVNGRGYAHTSEFYESERKFARHAEAEDILSKLAREVR